MTTRIGALVASWGARMLHVRWFVRAPIAVYRCRLGAMFGSRLLMLEHTGRVSGELRRVVLEVVAHPARDVFVVVSGFGDRAQWFRNVCADPHVRLVVGSRRPRDAVARRLDQDAAEQALDTYARQHPLAWARLRPVLEQTLGATIGAHDPALPLIALTLR